MTGSAPINVLQRLMRRWDAHHPYNAAQFLRLTERPVAEDWYRGWPSTLKKLSLGPVVLGHRSYRFDAAIDGSYQVASVTGPFDGVASSHMNHRFDDPAEPPFRPVLIDDCGTFYAGVVYQHWLADSAAIRVLVRQWFLDSTGNSSAADPRPELPHRGYWSALGRRQNPIRHLGSVLELARRHTRLRRVRKVDGLRLSDPETAYRTVATPLGLIDKLRAESKRREVKVTDLFLAALAATAAKHVPLQRRKRRTDLAVGSVVDLRPHSGDDSSGTFGLYLGFTNFICREAELRSPDEVLKAIARQTCRQKKAGVAPASLMWMSAALVVGSLSKPGDLYRFYRKEMPLAAGLSNVDLSREWPAGTAGVQDYIRISPTGPMTPLVLTTTTIGSRLNIGLTHRTGLIPTDLAEEIGRSFVGRLEWFCRPS